MEQKESLQIHAVSKTMSDLTANSRQRTQPLGPKASSCQNHALPISICGSPENQVVPNSISDVRQYAFLN